MIAPGTALGEGPPSAGDSPARAPAPANPSWSPPHLRYAWHTTELSGNPALLSPTALQVPSRVAASAISAFFSLTMSSSRKSTRDQPAIRRAATSMRWWPARPGTGWTRWPARPRRRCP